LEQLDAADETLQKRSKLLIFFLSHSCQIIGILSPIKGLVYPAI
jgi:hypothetical protein